MKTADISIDRVELLKWISERNMHIPMCDLAFLIGISPFSGLADSELPSSGLLKKA
ncbi:MAG: hypothetical protein Q9M31_09210 [Mariprofundus sp.]|nr:hypothetical protein [Mariprofundus sp.]